MPGAIPGEPGADRGSGCSVRGEPRSDIGPTGAGPDFEAFLKRDLAFCGYLVVPPFDVLGAEEIETAHRDLQEKWRAV